MNLSRRAQGVRSALLVTCAALLASAHAAPAGDARIAPVDLADSGLSISAPSGPVGLGSGAPGTTFDAPLGDVTVTAAAGVSSWTATVTLASSFRVTQGDQSWVLPDDRVSYRSGAGSLTNIVGLNLCSTGLLDAPATLVQTRTAYSCQGLTGLLSTSVRWNPTLTIKTQPTDPAGTYTGTITHSVL